jgi:hypothetical protein
MTDTSASTDAHLRALFRARSPAERLRMATGMFTTAKQLALAGLQHNAPFRDHVALRMALLERLYGDELSLEVRTIVARSGEAER